MKRVLFAYMKNLKKTKQTSKISLLHPEKVYQKTIVVNFQMISIWMLVNSKIKHVYLRPNLNSVRCHQLKEKSHKSLYKRMLLTISKFKLQFKTIQQIELHDKK